MRIQGWRHTAHDLTSQACAHLSARALTCQGPTPVPSTASRHSGAHLLCSPSGSSTSSDRRRCTAASAILLAAAVADGQRLADIELSTVLNSQGLIRPQVPEGTQASVFAIFNQNKKLEYVGFSKDLRNSLRTLFGRRPDKAFFYKATHLQVLDQQQMIDIRTSWFEEAGGPPNGNRLTMERNYWQLPISAGAISDRGKQQAAEKDVENLRIIFRSRGCKEDLVPDPVLLADGKVDFLPADALTADDIQRQKDAAASINKSLRNVVAVVDGQPADFQIFVQATYNTKGGRIFDVLVTYEERETNHRVIVGKEYYEDFDLQPEQVLDRAFAYLLGKKVQRQTEGLLMNGEFPINYFSISTIEQYFGDFTSAYLDTGKALRGDEKFWRFNRVFTYGHQAGKELGEKRTAALAESRSEESRSEEELQEELQAANS